ncbi:Xan family putative trans-acting RiPP leader peptide [Myxococcus landrumensis]|uniref:Xan family putative trans-acting RiPP leader peptide n=1 Tax=Myxococcus landrumensis TaxID=2813577 RepID=A0ABX7NG29_9BACT|nr:Xan family putative trans-acting RiPP leader peptide [Myxococcus landrumus]QSQ17759.1 Xan family putative trans-acting RiPP leader peptide [Myxococcus landrumus]
MALKASESSPVAPSTVSEASSAPMELAASETVPPPEKLDEIEEIDFLLEEIESKIAPLALA